MSVPERGSQLEGTGSAKASMFEQHRENQFVRITVCLKEPMGR